MRQPACRPSSTIHNRQTSRKLQVPVICHDLNIDKAVLLDQHRFGFNTRMPVELLTWTDLVRCRRVMERKPGGGVIATVLEPGERLGTAVVLHSSR